MTNSRRIRRKIGTWRGCNNCWNRRPILPWTRSARWLPRVKVPVHAEEVFALVAPEFYSTLWNRRRVWMWHTIRMNLASRQKSLWMTMFFTREPYLVCFIHKLYHLFIKLSFHSKIYLRLQLFPGKNPRPICVPVPRFQFIKACVRFYNIYFQGRNIHTCVNMEGKFRDTTIFKVRYRLR